MNVPAPRNARVYKQFASLTLVIDNCLANLSKATLTLAMQSLGGIVAFSVLFALTIIETQAASRYLKTSEFCSQKNVAKADETLKQLTSLGEGSRYFPENQKQLKTYCR